MALIVITGGARCGKSAVAESLAYTRLPVVKRVIVAVFGNPYGDDIEFAENIRNYQKNRPEQFETLEAFYSKDWLSSVPTDALLIVDSLGTALSALFAQRSEGASTNDSINSPVIDSVEAELNQILDMLVSREGDTIIVTNEVGNGLVPSFESGRMFRDLLGRANRYLVDVADAAYLCVCGRLIELDSLPRMATWPED